MFRLRKRDWIILPIFIVAVAVGYVVYSEWAGPEAGLQDRSRHEEQSATTLALAGYLPHTGSH